MILNHFYFVVLLTFAYSGNAEKPNIVFIIADDLGWNDVSFHGSDEIMTPNIDILGFEGVILNQYYTDAQGTASMSALLTGKYPIRLGTQGASITACEDRGIPISERLLPSHLKELGYSTHLIGKWNVGKSRENYLPTYRGFDTFYGFLGESVDYYTYNLIKKCNDKTFFGLNLYDNLEPVENATGHLTELLTKRAIQVIEAHNTSIPMYLQIAHPAPHAGGGLVNLQPPVNTIEANKYIAHSARRLYAAQVTSLDRSVGQIITALGERNMLDNTVILFVSDNGAAPIGSDQNFGSNLPLRGLKATPWEGATRSIGIIWYSLLTPKIHDGLFHVTDWVPTLLSIAEQNISEVIDGVDQWNAIRHDEKTKRSDIVVAIDDLNGWAAFREDDLKIIIGDVRKNTSDFYGKEIHARQGSIPLYENILLECDAARVFRETLDFTLNVDLAIEMRKQLNLTRNYTENKSLCIPTKTQGCLFNITADPMETNDLWDSQPDVVTRMVLRLRTLWKEASPRQYEYKSDLRADPSLNNYVWSPWITNEEMIREPPETISPFPLKVSFGELEYLINLNFDMIKHKLDSYIKTMGESFLKTFSAIFSL